MTHLPPREGIHTFLLLYVVISETPARVKTHTLQYLEETRKVRGSTCPSARRRRQRQLRPAADPGERIEATAAGKLLKRMTQYKYVKTLAFWCDVTNEGKGLSKLFQRNGVLLSDVTCGVACMSQGTVCEHESEAVEQRSISLGPAPGSITISAQLQLCVIRDQAECVRMQRQHLCGRTGRCIVYGIEATELVGTPRIYVDASANNQDLNTQRQSRCFIYHFFIYHTIPLQNNQHFPHLPVFTSKSGTLWANQGARVAI
jgi:hypothetical protein